MIANPVQRAFDAFNDGKMQDAAAICEQLLREEPKHAPALMLLGLIAAKENRLDGAVSLLKQSVDIETTPWSLTKLAGCLTGLRRLEEGLAYAEQTVAEYPEFAEGYLTLANSLHGLRRFDAALAQIRIAKQRMPRSPLVEARLGCIYAQLGDYVQAMQHFQAAERLRPSFAHCRLIDYRLELWEAIEPEAANGAANPGHSPGSDAVVASFCDAAYFYKYGTAFVNSFARNAGRGKWLHLHIIDPDAGFMAHFDGLTRSLGLTNIAITTETAPPGTTAHENLRKTYYSCVRFLHLNRLLRQYRTTIACFDIDIVFEMPLDKMLAGVAGKDVGLISRDPPDSPWLDIVANVIVAQPTAMADRYFAAVAAFIQHHAERGEWYWHLDQIALRCVLKMMERYDDSPEVGWIPQHSGPVWHIGHAYDGKLEDARYRRYGGRIAP